MRYQSGTGVELTPPRPLTQEGSTTRCALQLFVGTIAKGASRRSRLPTSGVGAAVDGQPGAIDGTCFGARNEGDQGGDVIRLAIARDRHAFHHDR